MEDWLPDPIDFSNEILEMLNGHPNDHPHHGRIQKIYKGGYY